MSGTIPQGEMLPIFIMTETTVAQKSVWVGLCGNGALSGPFFFEGNVNGENYLQMLNGEVFPQLVEVFDDQFDNGTFQRLRWAQNGMPGHRAREVRNWLLEFFQHRVIASYHESEWPARSPDMNPCDYSLGGFLKTKVFSTPPHTTGLRQRIITEVDAVKRN